MSILQPHINAATVIQRVAKRANRKPETRAALMLAAALLLRSEVKVEWNLIEPDGEPWLQPWSDDEQWLRAESSRRSDWLLVSRIRVTTAPLVEDYQPATHLQPTPPTTEGADA